MCTLPRGKGSGCLPATTSGRIATKRHTLTWKAGVTATFSPLECLSCLFCATRHHWLGCEDGMTFTPSVDELWGHGTVGCELCCSSLGGNQGHLWNWGKRLRKGHLLPYTIQSITVQEVSPALLLVPVPTILSSCHPSFRLIPNSQVHTFACIYTASAMALQLGYLFSHCQSCVNAYEHKQRHLVGVPEKGRSQGVKGRGGEGGSGGGHLW